MILFLEQAITEHIRALLVCQPNGYADKKVTNDITIRKEIKKGGKCCHYNIK